MSDSECSDLRPRGRGYGGTVQAPTSTMTANPGKSSSSDQDMSNSPSSQRVLVRGGKASFGSGYAVRCTLPVCLLSGLLVVFILTSVILSVTVGVLLSTSAKQDRIKKITANVKDVLKSKPWAGFFGGATQDVTSLPSEWLFFFMLTSVILSVIVSVLITRGFEQKSNKTNISTNLVSVLEFEAHAKKVLDKNAWAYFSRGATEQVTLHDNIAAFHRLRIRPNRQVNVSGAETSLLTATFGGHISVPIGFSPTAGHWWAHPEGEVATANAAVNLNTVMIVSTDSTTMTTRLAKEVPGALLWQQMYMFSNVDDTLYVVRLAERSGCKALVLTIDKTTRSIFYVNMRRPSDYPSESNNPPNLLRGTDFPKERDWKDVTWLTQQTSLPVIVKGVLTASEARQAIDHGASGILVSNHGGRTLDGVPATIDQLAEVVEEVKGAVPVYMDGGIRSGMDIFKALALGADMVFLGRPVIWGLVHSGHEGVEKVVKLMTAELVNTMQLAGANNLTAIKPHFIYRASGEICYSTQN